MGLPLAVAALAAAACLPGATGHALYGDEVASARIVTEPSLGRVLTHVRRTESTPPAWYAAAWAVRKAGIGDVASLRLLSVLFAAAAAALTAIWARRLLGGQLVAALAGSLVAVGSVPVEYAEQLRSYALVVLASVAFGLLLVEAALRPRRWAFAWLAAVVSIGALTHYFFLFVLAAGVVWLWVARPPLPARGRASLAIGAGLLAFAPWLPSFHEQEAHGRYRWIGGFDPLAVAKLPGELFFGPDGLLYGLARLAVTVAVAGAAVVLWRAARRERGRHARVAADRCGGDALGGRRADLQRAQPAPGRAPPGDLGRRRSGRAAGSGTTVRRGSRDRSDARRRRVCPGDAWPCRLRLARPNHRRLRPDEQRRDRRRGAERRDSDRLARVLVPPESSGVGVATVEARLPDALRNRPCARAADLARSPQGRPGGGVHLLRPPDPRPPARQDRGRPVPSTDSNPGRVLLPPGRRVPCRRFAAWRPRLRPCTG